MIQLALSVVALGLSCYALYVSRRLYLDAKRRLDDDRAVRAKWEEMRAQGTLQVGHLVAGQVDKALADVARTVARRPI